MAILVCRVSGKGRRNPVPGQYCRYSMAPLTCRRCSRLMNTSCHRLRAKNWLTATPSAPIPLRFPTPFGPHPRGSLKTHTAHPPASTDMTTEHVKAFVGKFFVPLVLKIPQPPTFRNPLHPQPRSQRLQSLCESSKTPRLFAA
jgi:hypothetical protein